MDERGRHDSDDDEENQKNPNIKLNINNMTNMMNNMNLMGNPSMMGNQNMMGNPSMMGNQNMMGNPNMMMNNMYMGMNPFFFNYMNSGMGFNWTGTGSTASDSQNIKDSLMVNIHLPDKKVVTMEISTSDKISEIIEKIKNEYHIEKFFKLMINGKPLVNMMTVAEHGIEGGAQIFVSYLEDRSDDFIKKTNIRFIYNDGTKINQKYDFNLSGLAKTCLINEILSKLSNNDLDDFDEKISCILKLLKNGKIQDIKNLKDETKEFLEKIRISMPINFVNYIDKTITPTIINKMMNLLCRNDQNKIILFKDHLCKMSNKIAFFDKEFENARRRSVFEFSLVSLEIYDRPDIDAFENLKANCPNNEQKILYQGNSENNIRKIVTSHFKKNLKNFFGEGVYFSDSLDFSCVWARQTGDNRFKLPRLDEAFSFVGSAVFYDNQKENYVINKSHTPKLNEVNIAYINGKTNTLKKRVQTKFYSKEYIIGENKQILPFIHIKIKRIEYCVIWRDPNFSPNPVYNDKYDNVFKKFLSERKEYIYQFARFNIYPCETTKEALELVKKKKHNKIILMSNAGADKGGKDFIDKARMIIGSNVICLFSAYMIEHLEWISKYPNSLFSNDPQFYEQYLECFTDDEKATKNNILTLKKSIEGFYKVEFTFDDKFLDYPNFKDSGDFSDLSF